MSSSCFFGPTNSLKPKKAYIYYHYILLRLTHMLQLLTPPMILEGSGIWTTYVAWRVTWNLHIWLNSWIRILKKWFIGPKHKEPQIRQGTCAPPTPQQFMEESGLLFQIRVRPQKDLDSLQPSIARERGSWLVLHNVYEIWLQVTPREIFLFS